MSVLSPSSVLTNPIEPSEPARTNVIESSPVKDLTPLPDLQMQNDHVADHVSNQKTPDLVRYSCFLFSQIHK